VGLETDIPSGKHDGGYDQDPLGKAEKGIIFFNRFKTGGGNGIF
jgi:hypothetical protein